MISDFAGPPLTSPSASFIRREGCHGQGMNAPGKLLRQYAVDQPVAREAVQPGKSVAHDLNTKVSLAIGMMIPVTRMLARLIYNAQSNRLQREGDFLFDSIPDGARHIFGHGQFPSIGA